jgi:hypothetical protein
MGSELLACDDMNFNAGAKVNFKKIPGIKLLIKILKDFYILNKIKYKIFY